MTINLHTLEVRYLEFCNGQEVSPNPAILSGFLKAKLQKSHHEHCGLQVYLDKLRNADFIPLINLFSIIDLSEIDTIDILHRSSCVLEGENILSLMRAVTQKLQIVDLHNLSFGEDFLWDLNCNGLSCQILNLRSSEIRMLNMVGNFIQLHTLNLDFCVSLTGFREDCFMGMPNLKCISMCETRVSNLWMTTIALSKLPSLVELRFQNCLCCNDTGPCFASSSGQRNSCASLTAHSNNLGMHSTGKSDTTYEGLAFQSSQCYNRRKFSNLVVDDATTNLEPHENITEESSDDSELDLSSPHHRMELVDVLANMFPELSMLTVTENEVNSNMLFPADEDPFSPDTFNSRNMTDVVNPSPKKYLSHNPSPICFEKHYREYMILALPQLKVLDNLSITDTDRELSKVVCAEYYETLPYNRKSKENLFSIIEKREVGSTIGHIQQSSSLKQSLHLNKSQYFFSRSMSAAKMASSSWPFVHPVLEPSSSMGSEESKRFRPRQFEYHPSDPSLMAFGTLDGELVVINHENGNVVGYTSSGTLSSVLGICWLKTYPSKLIAGSENGTLQLYDIRRMLHRITDRQPTASIATFDDFKQLTSVHVNSTDERFIASGYSEDVALYDIGSGKRLQTFTDMHHGHINVVKFAHQSPSLFVTSSFDHHVKMWDLRQRPVRPCYTASSSRGNVMVCFSPDDHYLLTSAVDNEVKQLLAVDGRVHINFEIASSGSSQNYTRSYYMNGRDYIISGSSDEHVVHICCAQTGRRLRDFPLEARGSGTSLFVQSLRGDPFRDFNMSILAAYMRPSSKSEIIKVNLMSSSGQSSEHSHRRYSSPSSSMGA